MTRCSRPSGPVCTDSSRSESVSPVSTRAAHERAQRIGFEHQREKRLAARLVDADGEQVLGGHVGVDHAQVRIEHDDAGGQRPDEIGRLEMGDRGRKEVFNRHAGLRPCMR